MKKTLSLIITIFFLFALVQTTAFCFAETELGEINADLAALVEEDNLNSKEAYTLFYNGERLIENSVGEDEEKAVFYDYKKRYDKRRAKDSVDEACDDEFRSVTIKGDLFFYYEAQYDEVLKYKNDFYEALEGDSDPYALADEFFENVKAIPDASTLLLERNWYITESLSLMTDSTLQIANASLEKRGYSVFTEVRAYNDEDFYDWYEEVLSAVFFSDSVSAILADHSRAVNSLSALPEESVEDDYLNVARAFVESLSAYTQRTATLQDGIKAIALQNAKDALANFLRYADSQKASYKKAVKEIVDRALERLESAETAQEISEIVSDAQKEISKIEVKDYTWVGLLITAIVIFLGSGVGVAFFFKAKARKKGVVKYNSLLEDERERMEKEIATALAAQDSCESKKDTFSEKAVTDGSKDESDE